MTEVTGESPGSIQNEPSPPHRNADAGPIGSPLPWIDWVRFLAALEVFLFHLRLYVFKPFETFAPANKNAAIMLWFAITHFGGEAVLIFFALSGYLVGGGLIQRVRSGGFKPGAYAIDRATRLLVPFVPALLCGVVLQGVRSEPIDPGVVIGNLVSLQGIIVPVQPYLGVDWSLAYEFWFYVLGGALAACLVTSRYRVTAIGLAALSLLIFSVLDADLLFCWIIGALVSQIKVLRANYTGILLGLIVSGLSLFLANDLFAGIRVRLQIPVVPIALWRITLSVGVLLVLRNLVAIPCRTVRARRIEALGTSLAAFSYSLYLMHIPILTVLMLLGLRGGQDISATSLFQYGCSILLVMFGAYAFYLAFERHTDTIRRWSKKRLAI
ncbi:acyltransferase [Sphingomonas sp.]|uniref:acyltransferase family protein n=1 Tax=Sphingomonas sp. TaxID=28214 RepID=UPI00333F5335